ncbi:putative NADH-flavin reductase [Balamuthia mandrillaris]
MAYMTLINRRRRHRPLVSTSLVSLELSWFSPGARRHMSSEAATVGVPDEIEGEAAGGMSMFLLGLTGRTGLPFARRALERGHRVTAVVRNKGRVPSELSSNPLLTCVEASIDDPDMSQPAINAAFARAQPDVIVTMLASDPKPHTGLSNGARAVVEALRANRTARPAEGNAEEEDSGADGHRDGDGEAPTDTSNPKPTRLIWIGGWGLGGPAEEYLARSWRNRLYIGAASMLFANQLKDARRAMAIMEDAQREGLLSVTQIQPPLLTNGPLTSTYESGDAVRFAHMNSWNTISRNDIADLALKLAEQAAQEEELPAYVAIRNA